VAANNAPSTQQVVQRTSWQTGHPLAAGSDPTSVVYSPAPQRNTNVPSRAAAGNVTDTYFSGGSWHSQTIANITNPATAR